MPSTVTTSAGHSLSADAISASQALASRERQEAAAQKKAAKGKVSLAGPVFGADGKPASHAVLARRVAMEEDASSRAAARPGAIRLDEGIKVTGTYDDVRSDGSVKKEKFKDATPERLVQALGVGEIAVIAGVRQVVDPFAVLRNKGLLDKDPSLNECLHQAGQDLRRRYDMADLGGVKAMNLMKDIVDGGSGEAGCPIADRAWNARHKIREAYAAVGPRLWPYVMGVVVEDRTVESLSGMVQDSKSNRLRYVIAMERLREALHRLCEAWNIRPNDKPRAIQSVRDGGERTFERRSRGEVR